MYLYLDTTNKIIYGIVDKNFKWLVYKEIESKKSSAELHYLIYEQNKNAGIKLEDVDGVIYCSGPGSYTGMRVSEGLVNILNWQDFKAYSFYHFEIPKLLGVESGNWISKAFKGEYFNYSWDKDGESTNLVSEDELNGISEIFSHDVEYCSDKKHNTAELIRENSAQTLKKIVERNELKDLYYYRPLNEEFKRS